MTTKSNIDHLAKRVDSNRLEIPNDFGIPISLFANQHVPIEPEAIEQLLKFASIQKTCEQFKSDFWDIPGKISQIVLTPDFHYGPGIPIGTVCKTENFIIPQAIGNDIACGMRTIATDVTKEELTPHISKLKNLLRTIFFEGKREIIMSPKQREALLRDGLWGLLETSGENKNKGIWNYYDPLTQESDLEKTHFNGVLPAKDIFNFADYVNGSGGNDSRDSQTGTLGSGNHFAELQSVDDIQDGGTAYRWGITKNMIAIMIHSGSVGFGHAVGDFFKDKAIEIYQKTLKRPDHGFFIIPTTGRHQGLSSRYLDAMNNAANFAFGNRLFLGLMAIRAISEVLGRRIHTRLVYDAPHNLMWANGLHRKGACPAELGSAVLIPGSMGDSSYVLVGQGNVEALQSACHGAGRQMSRSKARQHSKLDDKLHVVTPVDPESPVIKSRPDILKEYHNRLIEESSLSYKSVTSVIESVRDAGIAAPVAKFHPLITVKG